MGKELGYLIARTREAGLGGILEKFGQKFRPYIFYPVYAFGVQPITGTTERIALRAFGALCAQTFREVGAVDPGRACRVAERLALAEAADAQVLGYGEFPKPRGAAWHVDPAHRHAWAPRYFPVCDFVAPDTYCDVKIPWELSRLQSIVWLGEALVFAAPVERERLRARFLATVKDWVASNPTGYGVNWTCGMEVAIRGTNLAIAAGVFAEDLDDSTTDWLTTILREHLQFLRRFPEVSDVPGNHYLTNLMGEVVLNGALDGLSAPVTCASFKTFAAEADRQFEPDGCHIERATIYHRLAYDIVALPLAFAFRTGNSVAPTLAGVAKRAAEFMALLCNESGCLPVFGDQDSGFVLWFGEMAQIADRRLTGEQGAPETDLYSFLGALAGDDAFFPKVSRAAGTRSGFATLASAPIRVTMKTGPQGLLGRAPHDHDDALSIVVAWGHRNLLIDPGCHSYTLDPKIRQETIVSSRHNAPAPGSRERFPPTYGSINATVRGAPTATLLRFTATEMVGKLASMPASRMEIERRVLLRDLLRIEDRWVFERAEAARILWLIDPVWRIEGPSEVKIPPSGIEICLIASEEKLRVAVRTDGAARLRCFASRYSPNYGAYAACGALEIITEPAIAGASELLITQ